MITKYLYTRLAYIALVFAAILTACAPTALKPSDLARINPGGQIQMLNGDTLDSLAPEAIAINAVLTGQRGAFALINEAKELVVFLTPAGKCPSGGTFYFTAFVSTARVNLLDARWQLQALGIESGKIQ